MSINLAKDLVLSKFEADKILKVAYLKGYFKKCEDVTNGCDVYRYIPMKRVVEFHIKDPMFWIELTLEKVIECQIEILEREIHFLQKELKNKDN